MQVCRVTALHDTAFTAAAGAAAVGVLTLRQAYKHRLRPACKLWYAFVL